jgi:integrase
MPRGQTASLFRRSGVWYVSWWKGGTRVKESTGTDNRKVAEDVRRQREKEMILGETDLQHEVSLALNDPRRREAVLKALETVNAIETTTALKEYLAHCETFKRPKTVAGDRGRLNAFFGQLTLKYLNDLTPKHVAEFFSTKAKRDGASPATILRYREILHALCEWAMKQDYLKENPVAKVARPRIPEHDIRFLTLADVGKCLESVSGQWIEAAVATAIYGGLRREELCWLTWEDVELEGKQPILRVRSKTVDGNSWMPKTKRNRSVPISADLLPFLRRQALRSAKSPWVFPSPEGHRWNPDNMSADLRKAMENAGLEWSALDFRHTFGSQLAQKGVSLYKISALMGNSPEIARRHYARLIPEEMHADVEFPKALKQA